MPKKFRVFLWRVLVGWWLIPVIAIPCFVVGLICGWEYAVESYKEMGHTLWFGFDDKEKASQ